MRAERYVTLRKDLRDTLKYVVQDVNGNSIYVGPLYHFPDAEGDYRAFTGKLLGAGILLLIVSMSGGFYYFSGMNTPWMLGPYVPEIIGVVMALISAMKARSYKDPMKYFEYTASFQFMFLRFLLASVGAFAGFGCILYYNIRFGMHDLVIPTVTYLLSRLFVGTLAFMVFRKLSKIEFDLLPGIDKTTIQLCEEDAMAEEEDDFEAKIQEKLHNSKKDRFKRDYN